MNGNEIDMDLNRRRIHQPTWSAPLGSGELGWMEMAELFTMHGNERRCVKQSCTSVQSRLRSAHAHYPHETIR